MRGWLDEPDLVFLCRLTLGLLVELAHITNICLSTYVYHLIRWYGIIGTFGVVSRIIAQVVMLENYVDSRPFSLFVCAEMPLYQKSYTLREHLNYKRVSSILVYFSV